MPAIKSNNPLRVVALALVVLAGCSRRPRRVEPPHVDAAAAAGQAIAAYDTDGDGSLAGAELDRAPALRAAMPRVDTAPQDGEITAGEITALIRQWQERRLALIPVGCKVTLDGRALAGATVTLEPEPFLGSALQPASGSTSANGTTGLSIAQSLLPQPTLHGVYCGLYKVRISQKRNGKERIPAKYNTETTLGCEIAMGARGLDTGVLSFDLKSK